jgi:hypothetical protein
MGQGESKPVIEWAREEDDINEYDWLAFLTQALYVVLNTHEEHIKHRPSDFSIENLIYTEDNADSAEVELNDETYMLPIRGWRVDYTNEEKIPVSVQRERDRMLYSDLHVLATSLLNSNITLPESIQRRLLLIYNPLIDPENVGNIRISSDSYKHSDTVANLLVDNTKKMAYTVFTDLISKSRAISEHD